MRRFFFSFSGKNSTLTMKSNQGFKGVELNTLYFSRKRESILERLGNKSRLMLQSPPDFPVNFCCFRYRHS